MDDRHDHPAPDDHRDTSPGRATVRAWGDGDRRWFLHTWSAIAVDHAATGGAVDVVTRALPAGYCPPAHRHARREEVLIVLRGEVELTCGPDRWLLGPGAVAHIPRGTPHALTVSLAEPADVIIVGSPAGLGALVAELGTADAPPVPTAPDLRALVEAGARHDLVLEDGAS